MINDLCLNFIFWNWYQFHIQLDVAHLLTGPVSVLVCNHTINWLTILSCQSVIFSVLTVSLMPCFFLQYLQTLHLQSCDLLDIFGGISFFPLDKMTYLKIQSFINRMEESLSIVKYTAFLYNDQLIWYVHPKACHTKEENLLG